MRERILLHQVHPFKLAVDWGTGFAAAWLLWDQKLLPALIVGFVPSIAVSIFMILRVDLSPLKDSSFGRYVLSARTRPNDSVRLAGRRRGRRHPLGLGARAVRQGREGKCAGKEAGMSSGGDPARNPAAGEFVQYAGRIQVRQT